MVPAFFAGRHMGDASSGSRASLSFECWPPKWISAALLWRYGPQLSDYDMPVGVQIAWSPRSRRW